jgi:hypothetical protein
MRAGTIGAGSVAVKQVMLAASLISLWSAGAFAQSTIKDDFRSGTLDWSLWCPCQMDMTNAPPTFSPNPDQAGDQFMSIVANEASLGGNVCRSASPHSECRPPAGTPAFTIFMSDIGAGESASEVPAIPDEPEALGPSFIRPPQFLSLDSTLGTLTKRMVENRYCNDEVLQQVHAAGEEDECIQRQELRPQGLHAHSITRPYRYSIRFRMPRVIEDQRSSIRWVISQWKQEPISTAYERKFGERWGPSPFLAQRFDNGILHVTIQDEHCRCMVASAPLPNGSNLIWKNGPAQYCISTRPEDPPNFACVADLQVEYGPDPVLTSPRGQWVEMTYRVEAGRSGRAVIEVREGKRFIVRVTGKIGYAVDPGQDSQVKFKFGAYRDYMPFVHSMDVDWIDIEPVY